MITEREFLDQYWKYYRYLEDDFLTTERYVTFHEKNNSAFSNEYLKILTATCCEIDNQFKKLCKMHGITPSTNNLPNYYLKIQSPLPNFAKEVVTFIPTGTEIQPWDDCTYTIQHKKDEHGPQWWEAFNSNKHKRTELDKGGLYNFQRANQENTRDALAALFEIEMYIYDKLTKGQFKIILENPTRLFKMKNWDCKKIPINNVGDMPLYMEIINTRC